MGAWSELDTEITVDVDNSRLEEGKNLPEEDPYGFFDVWIDRIDRQIQASNEGAQIGGKMVAEQNAFMQQQFILQVTDNPSGMLMTSIQVEGDDEVNDSGEYSWLVGTIINHIYPMALEYGRGPVYPINAKALAFYADGELIFRKSVGPAKPRPFVAPAYERTMQIAERIVKDELAKAYIRYGVE